MSHAHAEALDCEIEIPDAAIGQRGFLAAVPADGAAELHRLALDERIHMVLMAVGGHNTNLLLSHLDFELLGCHPKIYCGHSDATALLVAMHARARMVTFHGPALLPQFGEVGGPFPETVASLPSSKTSLVSSGIVISTSRVIFTMW